jgi:hypothetical protein
MANKQLEERLTYRVYSRILRQTVAKDKRVFHVVSNTTNDQCWERVKRRVWLSVSAPVFDHTWFAIKDQATEDYRG